VTLQVSLTRKLLVAPVYVTRPNACLSLLRGFLLLKFFLFFRLSNGHINDVNRYPKTEGRVWLLREQELTVGLSWVLTMGN
jgi:hypothetical protein